jgi:hypothetical protein
MDIHRPEFPQTYFFFHFHGGGDCHGQFKGIGSQWALLRFIE